MRGKKKAAEGDRTSDETSEPVVTDDSTSTEPPESAKEEDDAHPPGPAVVSDEGVTFEENEIVLAKDSGKIYNAKIVRVQEARADKPRQYFIHYVGWNAKWDKWVAGKDLLKDTEENRKHQKEANAAKKRGGEPKVKGEKEDGQKRKKASLNLDIEIESSESQVKLTMPFTLKKQLVDDWEMITREPHQLVPLPRSPSAAEILAMYIEQKRDKNSTSALQLQRFQELMEGIRLYFDKALPLILLYRHEREQYERAKADAMQRPDGGKTFVPSEVYGAEHLLRLFVRLPNLLSQASMSPQEVLQVQAKLTDFLKFLQRNHNTFFLTLYKKHDEVVKPLPLMPVDQNGMPKEALKGADSVAKGPPLVAAE